MKIVCKHCQNADVSVKKLYFYGIIQPKYDVIMDKIINPR